MQICYNSGPHLIKTDLSVGVISVLTDIVWKITVAWHAGNIACKVIRFSQVRLRVSIRPNSCATSCLYSRRDFLSFWLGDLFCSLCTSDKQNWSRGTCSSPTFVVVTKKKRKEKKNDVNLEMRPFLFVLSVFSSSFCFYSAEKIKRFSSRIRRRTSWWRSASTATTPSATPWISAEDVSLELIN